MSTLTRSQASREAEKPKGLDSASTARQNARTGYLVGILLWENTQAIVAKVTFLSVQQLLTQKKVHAISAGKKWVCFLY